MPARENNYAQRPAIGIFTTSGFDQDRKAAKEFMAQKYRFP